MGGLAQRVDGDFIRRRRTLDERLMVRAPWLYRTAARRLESLEPRAALRRRLVHRQVVSAYAGVNRRDFELVMVRYADDCVYEFPPKFVTLGLPARVESAREYQSSIREWVSEWAEFILTANYVLDNKDATVALGRVMTRGPTSGVGLDEPYGQVVEVRDGLVEHERDFNDWNEALSAAGLDPGVHESLEALEPGATLEID